MLTGTFTHTLPWGATTTETNSMRRHWRRGPTARSPSNSESDGREMGMSSAVLVHKHRTSLWIVTCSLNIPVKRVAWFATQQTYDRLPLAVAVVAVPRLF